MQQVGVCSWPAVQRRIAPLLRADIWEGLLLAKRLVADVEGEETARRACLASASSHPGPAFPDRALNCVSG